MTSLFWFWVSQSNLTIGLCQSVCPLAITSTPARRPLLLAGVLWDQVIDAIFRVLSSRYSSFLCNQVEDLPVRCNRWLSKFCQTMNATPNTALNTTSSTTCCVLLRPVKIPVRYYDAVHIFFLLHNAFKWMKMADSIENRVTAAVLWSFRVDADSLGTWPALLAGESVRC